MILEPEIPINEGISSPDEEAAATGTDPAPSKFGSELEKDGIESTVDNIEDVTEEKETVQKTVCI